VLLQVTGTLRRTLPFCAGVAIDDTTLKVIETAPILKQFHFQTADNLIDAALYFDWTIEEVDCR
jgi:hypothetical protein